MITQEEIEAMVKTIAQLREEKQELIDKACEWVEDNICDYIETDGWGDFEILKEIKFAEMAKDLRKAMGE